MSKYEKKVIQLDEQDKKDIETIAAEESMTANQLIRNIIKEWLKKNSCPLCKIKITDAI